MKIAFDALPLLGRKTGIGHCAAGQIQALTKLYPQQEYILQYFSMKHGKQCKADIQPYLKNNTKAKHIFCSAYGYRLLSSFIPVPYHWFFGKEADITHFFNYIVPPYVAGKSVVTVHDMVYKAFPETVRNRTRHMLDRGLVSSMTRADRIITDSVFSQSEIIKYYPQFADKIRVVPCGVDLQKFYPMHDKSQIQKISQKYAMDTDYFLYLGTLEPRKNLENLLLAYAAFVQNYAAPPKLVLAGAKGWLYDSIFQLAQQKNIQQHVIFTQYIPDTDICALMNGAIAFVFPSIYEGFGMPPLEAMACGTPVLVSDAASLPEVTGDCAVLVKPEDIQAMTDGLYRLCTDTALTARLRRDGLARARQFSWEHSAEVLYHVYQELCP